jgi:hypothetical protein
MRNIREVLRLHLGQGLESVKSLGRYAASWMAG